MCTQIFLPDGQLIESTSQLSEFVAELHGQPGAWRDRDACLCGVDVPEVLLALGLDVPPARGFVIHVPPQPAYPARYSCADGPYAGAAFARDWGTVPEVELRLGEWGTDGHRSETVYRLDGEAYRLVSHREWVDNKAGG